MQSWRLLIVIILGLAGAVAVSLWKHIEMPVRERLGLETPSPSTSAPPPSANQPSPADDAAQPGRSETARPRASGVPSSPGFDPLFATLGILRPVEQSEALDFALPDLEGRPVRLREFRGKLVLLNFWATWCTPCLHEMPSMERLYQTFKQTPFVLLAVSTDRQGAQAAGPFVENLKLTFPVLLDSAAEVSRHYGVRGLPTSYLIDPDGRIIGAAIGGRDWSRTEAKALIAGLLRQAPALIDDPSQAHK
jgi:peroxiredoxin